jgi:hypothetical protein
MSKDGYIKPGEPVVVPAPGTVAEAAKRVEGGEDGLTAKRGISRQKN